MRAAPAPGPRGTAVALFVLLAFAAAYWLTVEPAATVTVRWRATVDQGRRSALERRFLLVRPVELEPHTYQYDLLDISRSNLRRLVTEPDAEDTTEIDRGNDAMPVDYPYGTGWTWIGNRVPLLRVRGVQEVMISGCVLVVMLPVVRHLGERRRAAKASPVSRST